MTEAKQTGHQRLVLLRTQSDIVHFLSCDKSLILYMVLVLLTNRNIYRLRINLCIAWNGGRLAAMLLKSSHYFTLSKIISVWSRDAPSTTTDSLQKSSVSLILGRTPKQLSRSCGIASYTSKQLLSPSGKKNPEQCHHLRDICWSL